MYSKDGQDYFIVDAHIALWDARPENQRNVQGRQFIDCFYDYHRNLSPESEVWPYEEYLYQGGERLMKDLFEDGLRRPRDLPAGLPRRVLPPGLRPDRRRRRPSQAAHPDKLTYNHFFDPRDGEKGLDRLRKAKEQFGLKGVKLYTAEWHGDSRGYKLSDPMTYRYLELCRELGIKNIHVHKGPTIRPLDRDAFDVADVDHCATDFTDLNFIVEHVGLPRLEDFCWIATQEPNVYGGLAVAMPFIHTRPRYFAQIMGELHVLDRRGPDPVLLGLRALDAAVAGRVVRGLPDPRGHDRVRRRSPRTQKKKILGLNAAKMYDIPVPAQLQLPDADETETGPREPARADLAAV